MAGNIEYDRAKIEHRGGKILLAQIPLPAYFLNFSGDARPVVSGYVELLDRRYVLCSNIVNNERTKKVNDLFLRLPIFHFPG